jgi:hypothetical protein
VQVTKEFMNYSTTNGIGCCKFLSKLVWGLACTYTGSQYRCDNWYTLQDPFLPCPRYIYSLWTPAYATWPWITSSMLNLLTQVTPNEITTFNLRWLLLIWVVDCKLTLQWIYLIFYIKMFLTPKIPCAFFTKLCSFWHSWKKSISQKTKLWDFKEVSVGSWSYLVVN